MSDRRRGLGRGLGALIPQAPTGARPSDVFFPRSQVDGEPAGSTGADVDLDHEVDATGTPDQTGSSDPADSVEPVPTGPVEPVPADSVEPVPTASVEQGEPTERADQRASSVADGAAPVPEEPDLAPVPGAEFREVPVDLVDANPRQPRQVFDEDELAELEQSVREIGVLQPVVVRRKHDTDGAERYELVMGERRLRASRMAGAATIPAIIRDTGDDVLLRDALLENLHRSQLNPLEEAAAYQQLLEDFGCTQEELAGRIGRSRPQISNTIRLLKLPPLVQRRVASGVLSAGHARALLGLPDGAAMERLAQRIVAEGLSVRSVEEIVLLGEQQAPARRTGRTSEPRPDLDEAAARLADRLDTRVSIAMGKRKGRVTVEFASTEDLDRILDLLGTGRG